MTEDKFNILERFSCSDTQDLCAEVRRLRNALGDIYLASRDDGLDRMREIAIVALTTDAWTIKQNCPCPFDCDHCHKGDQVCWRGNPDTK